MVDAIDYLAMFQAEIDLINKQIATLPTTEKAAQLYTDLFRELMSARLEYGMLLHATHLRRRARKVRVVGTLEEE